MITFRGGIKIEENKLTSMYKIEKLYPKDKVIIPMMQYIGSECTVIVNVGDYVKIGQKIGESTGSLNVPVHASISGEVVLIDKLLHPSGDKVTSVVIKNDQKYEVIDEMKKENDLLNMNKDEIISIIKEAGIVGMGGATFPTYLKMLSCKDNIIENIIIDGAECEPYVTSDHRVMLEMKEDIKNGILILRKLYEKANIYLAIEDNKKDAYNELKEYLNELYNVKCILVKSKYPQGAEKFLIKAILKKEVPNGKLPKDIGVLVQNVFTLVNIKRAVINNEPSIKRIITVTGNVNELKNVEVPIGIMHREILEFCNGAKENTSKIISGGPMMGHSLFDLDVPVMKGSLSILALNNLNSHEENCIRCAKCINHCPMGLNPTLMNKYSISEQYSEFKKINGHICIKCGTCSFVCPAKRNLTQSFKMAIDKLKELKK